MTEFSDKMASDIGGEIVRVEQYLATLRNVQTVFSNVQTVFSNGNAAAPTAAVAAPAKKRPGRPKGSGKKRGRPKGSKNKPRTNPDPLAALNL